MAEGAQALLESIGFSGRRLTDTLGNEKILNTLLEVLKEVGSDFCKVMSLVMTHSAPPLSLLSTFILLFVFVFYDNNTDY